MSKVNSARMPSEYTTETQIHQHWKWDPNFCPFRFSIIHFWVTAQFFRKVHQITPKWPWHAPGKKYGTWGSKFHPFHFTTSHFHIRAQLGDKCTKWPWHLQGTKWPWHLQGQKYTYMYVLYNTHLSAPNDPDMYKVKCTHMNRTMNIMPLRPKLSSVSLYGKLFLRKLRFLNLPLSTM